jgi:hypothetical protein
MKQDKTNMDVQMKQAGDAAAAQWQLGAELHQALVQALMQGVQQCAELNWQAAQRLLSQSAADRAEAPAARIAEAWRFSWNSYQVCSTTSADLIDLACRHGGSSLDELWRDLERLLAPNMERAHVDRLRTAFEGLRGAQTAFWNATLSTQRELLSLFDGALKRRSS